MFEIKEITVTASCSKNYQKAEFTMTAMVECDEDIAAVKSLCTQHALQLLETLPIREETKQPVQAPVHRPVQNTGNPYFQNTPKPVQKPKTEVINIEGYNYRKCVNKQGGVFYALVNDADAQYAKKYLQVEEVQAYFGGNQYGN